MRFGIVEGDTIINVIEAESLEAAEAATSYNHELAEGAEIGWVRDSDGWGPPPVKAVRRKLSSLEFEFHVQQSAGLTDEDVLAMVDDPNLRLFWMRLNKALEIDPEHPVVAQGLDALVALGHLTEEQVATVLDEWPRV